MHRQPGLLALAREDLEDEVVQRKGSDAVAMHPLSGMNSWTRGRDGVIQSVATQKDLHVASTQQNDVAWLDRESGECQCSIEIIGPDGVTTWKSVYPASACDVEQNTATDNCLDCIDTAKVSTFRGDSRCGVAVVQVTVKTCVR